MYSKTLILYVHSIQQWVQELFILGLIIKMHHLPNLVLSIGKV